MTAYNSQYEAYYNNMLKNNSRNRISAPLFTKDKLIRRVIQELVGGLILFLLLIVCKLNVLPNSKFVYTYCKNIVLEDFDYKYALSWVQSIDINKINLDQLNNSIGTFVEKIKDEINSNKDVMQETKSSFSVPAQGKILSGFSKSHEGIDIEDKLGSDILSCADGKVVEIGNEKTLGQYIVIDNGNGVETKFAPIASTSLKVSDKVKKGGAIGKTDKAIEGTVDHLHFELLYMGKNQDPEQYIDFNKQ